MFVLDREPCCAAPYKYGTNFASFSNRARASGVQNRDLRKKPTSPVVSESAAPAQQWINQFVLPDLPLSRTSSIEVKSVPQNRLHVTPFSCSLLCMQLIEVWKWQQHTRTNGSRNTAMHSAERGFVRSKSGCQTRTAPASQRSAAANACWWRKPTRPTRPCRISWIKRWQTWTVGQHDSLDSMTSWTT